MTVAADVPPELESYLAAVRDALADLPPAERDDLLSEVEVSLAEAASEGESAIVARLGPPQDFAAELRAAAGLHEQVAGHARRGNPRLTILARELATRALGDPRVAALRGLLGELAPIWWAARAYIAVSVIALAAGADWSIRFSPVPRIGTGLVGLLVIGVAAVASVGVGLLARRSGLSAGRFAITANLVLLLAAIPVAVHLVRDIRQGPTTSFVYVTLPEVPPGLFYNGSAVDNIYPYDRNGRRLFDVRLYDGAGRPIDLVPGVADPQRRLLRTAGRRVVFNSFPIRYYEPGTNRIARPNAGPRVHSERVVTPPVLEHGRKARKRSG